MSDIVSLTSQLANANNAAQVRAAVRPETPLPLATHDAVAPTLNTPQNAVLQTPNTEKAETQRQQANPDGRGGHGTHSEEPETPSTPAAPPPRYEVEEFLRILNKRLRTSHIPLQFSITGDASNWQIQVVDQNTRDVVRRISWEETGAFARALDEGQAQQTPATLHHYATGSNNEPPRMEGQLFKVKI